MERPLGYCQMSRYIYRYHQWHEKVWLQKDSTAQHNRTTIVYQKRVGTLVIRCISINGKWTKHWPGSLTEDSEFLNSDGPKKAMAEVGIRHGKPFKTTIIVWQMFDPTEESQPKESERTTINQQKRGHNHLR